ncbi:MAG: DUF423 domain-containing protein [Phototrophicaceae bacterium]|nr:hypothetical protein [Anaerolineae bacterium]MBW7878406.1 DUF423 domain-containing protein [Anaerolineae bacterium]MDL1914835.1 DUF423 domain-containing protein [Anaerolineae bacterium CFX4]OQY76666.1 MAG: hypothetical protein B6D42_16895 [Anaerolineae bacterium UTCFX5]RIK19953.1 MAG: DUF423 domain-containing protein [Chloroflexota bacterium]
MAEGFKTIAVLGALLGATGVALGAFGAHGLSAVLEANGRAATFDTASRYHLIHAVALLGIAALAAALNTSTLTPAGLVLTAGTVIFSGALYVLAIFDLRIMGAVAPVGGVLMVAGWVWVLVAVLRYTPPVQ